MNLSALQTHIEHQLTKQSQRSFSIQWQQQKIWVKQSEQKNSKFIPLLTHFISKLSNNPLYYPSVESRLPLKREAQRLNLMKEKGFNVPTVLLSHENYLVMTDIGPSVKDWLTDKNTATYQRQHILLAAATALAKLHQHHRWHGRPALRDLCWDGSQIGFIDFEEDPHQHLSIDQCMVRDVLIFVHGLYRYLPASDPAILQAIHQYRKAAPRRVWRDTQQIISNMWLAYPALAATQSLLGKDGRQAFLALKQLRLLSNKPSRKLPLLVLTAALAFAIADQFD